MDTAFKYIDEERVDLPWNKKARYSSLGWGKRLWCFLSITERQYNLKYDKTNVVKTILFCSGVNRLSVKLSEYWDIRISNQISMCDIIKWWHFHEKGCIDHILTHWSQSNMATSNVSFQIVDIKMSNIRLISHSSSSCPSFGRVLPTFILLKQYSHFIRHKGMARWVYVTIINRDSTLRFRSTSWTDIWFVSIAVM